MGFKAAASELGTEGRLRTRTDTDTVKAKSIRIRTYPYALETCLREVALDQLRCAEIRTSGLVTSCVERQLLLRELLEVTEGVGHTGTGLRVKN